MEWTAMTKLLVLAVTAAAFTALVSPANAASFNCYGRLTVTEAVICQNPGLSNLDSQMAAIYYSNLSASPRSARPAMRAEQAGWLRTRNGCGANLGCLRSMYKGRIDYLQSGD
jgi:uncharacterized protein